MSEGAETFNIETLIKVFSSINVCLLCDDFDLIWDSPNVSPTW